MNIETRKCQNCHGEFTIEPEDFNFYKKIDVPPPTWCPECRMQRRMLWRNIRNLYKRQCMVPEHNESIVSLYSADKSLIVYDQPYWWSDKNDTTKYGQEYDFSVPFFIQFMKLFYRTPLPNLSNINAVDSTYVNVTIGSKNCYLIFSASENENCLYSEGINSCRNSSDLLNSRNSERSYECIDCYDCFNVVYGTKSVGCLDSFYLYDCRNCANCFGCWNLRNKQYCIFNKQYSKEDYLKRIKLLQLGSRAYSEEMKQQHDEKLRTAVHRFAYIAHSENVTGNEIKSSKNCRNAFDVSGISDSKYVWRLLETGGSDDYDITVATKPVLSYEGCGVGRGFRSLFGIASGESSECYYTNTCISGCSHLFGCVGLTNKHYCILNKQYTKEEYEELVPRIIKHMNDMPYMDKKGMVYKYGEFFPSELSPFAYNETIAQEYFPLTKEDALAQGYRWKDPEKRGYEIEIVSNELPDNIGDVTDDILGKIIECAHGGTCQEQCTEAFKIIPQELQFYRQMNLPLPRLCPNCRHYQRLKQRNPLKLWHRRCQCLGNAQTDAGLTPTNAENVQRSSVSSPLQSAKYINTCTHFHGNDPCPNEFETSYAPERPEIVYCESCYNSEVA